MLKFRDWSFVLFLMVPLLGFAQNDVSTQAHVALENGLRANEALIEFLNSRQCEFGLVKGCDRPLSSKDIITLKTLFKKIDNWKNETFSEIVPAADYLSGREFVVKEGPHSIANNKGILHIFLDRNDEQSRILVHNMNIAVASNLVMYDSFLRLSEILSRARKIRSVLTSDMKEETKILRNMFKLSTEVEVWRATRSGYFFLEEASKIVPQSFSPFEQYIGSSFTGGRLKANDMGFRLKSLQIMREVLKDADFLQAFERLAGKLSEIFGNVVGSIQTRDGKLKKYAKDPSFMNSTKRKLRPLDILMEKTPFRLTDKFIPGFYGHVAIWLGRPEELVEMTVSFEGSKIPLLDHPKMRPYLESMSQGKLVVEALREPGVTMNTLEHFMDIDDFLVLSPAEIVNPGEHILRTIEQVGKPYDFNFDVETQSSIVCSELVYTVFDDREWPVSESMGRYTISPDQVAWKAVDSCLKPVLMYHDGVEVKGNLLAELEDLLQGPGGIRYTPTGRCY